mgnify:CR=1 FL=1
MNKKAMIVSEEGNDDSFEIRDIGNGKKRFVSTNAFLTRRFVSLFLKCPFPTGSNVARRRSQR